LQIRWKTTSPKRSAYWIATTSLVAAYLFLLDHLPILINNFFVLVSGLPTPL